jgi:protein-tyrosine phosphatase
MMNNDISFEKVRLLPLEGLYNVRDLGGYTAGDRQVRWGLLYRAGDLNFLTPQAKDNLETRNIKTIVDFRTRSEWEQAPDGELSTVKSRIHLPIDAGNIIDLTQAGAGADPVELMEKLYGALADKSLDQYRRFFHILAEPDSAPLIFHCSAGKDRTGVAAALLLAALGVDRETIFQDYLLSGECLEGKYTKWIKSAPHLAPFMTVDPRYIAAVFRYIDTGFGGVERYLREALGADPEQLRERYTEPRS